MAAKNTVRGRLEVKLENFAVRTRDDVVQFPDAEAWAWKDEFLVVKDGEGKALALLMRNEVEAIYYPGTVRVMETFYETFYDADGNVVEPEAPSDDD